MVDRTLWHHSVAVSSSSQKHGAKENGCTAVYTFQTNVGPQSSPQDVKIQLKGASCHYFTAEIVASTIQPLFYIWWPRFFVAQIYTRYVRYLVGERYIRKFCTYI